jgi:hypothetical protein
MNKPEAARLLGVADTDVRYVGAYDGGTEVLLLDGRRVLVSDDGGWYTLDDHPAAAQLRPWEGSSDEPTPSHDPPADEPGEEPDGDSESIDTDGDGVPDGSSAAVLRWVGDDHDRAARALLVEQERETPRKTLMGELQKRSGA